MPICGARRALAARAGAPGWMGAGVERCGVLGVAGDRGTAGRLEHEQERACQGPFLAENWT